MSKLTRKQKIEIYQKRKHGISLSTLSKEYKIRVDRIEYLVRLMDTHGTEILRKDKNRYYSPKLKEEIINKVLVHGYSINSTAIEYGLPSKGLLDSWIRSYKANGCVIVERNKGRPTTMKTKEIKNKTYEEMTDAEKIKYLEEKNLYLEAENEYLKKLRAVVQAEKNQRPSKK